MDEKNGRCVQLWPHGILFRDNEKKMRKKMIESDTVDCVIALGKNLFYNSSMESALLIRRTNKEKKKNGKILFINAYDEVKDEKTVAYLLEHHIDKIFKAYEDYNDEKGFSKVVSVDDVMKNDGSLHVTNYVKSTRIIEGSTLSFEEVIDTWEAQSKKLKSGMVSLFETIAL
jgi:type I restriction enzyme M protein